MNGNPSKLPRRTVLLSGATAALLPEFNRKASAAIDWATLSDPANRLVIYARIRSSGIDGPKALWWISGLIYAKQYGEMAKPLFRVVGVSWNQIMARPDGGVTQVMEEAGYFADIETGAIMDSWTNPITGAQTTPEPYRMTIGQGITRDGAVVRPDPSIPMDVSGAIGPVEVSGDVIWVEENFSARVTLLSPSLEGRREEREEGKFRVVDSLATFQARIDDVLQPEGTFVPATLAYQETDPWFPWLKMGDAPGLQIWQLKGRKLADPDEIPNPLKDRLISDYPDLI